MLPNNSDSKQFSIFRLGKVLFASYAFAVGGLILTIVLGAMVLGFEVVDGYIENYSGYILLLFAIAAFPFVWKHLK
jgi:hypothetical protein